MSVTYHVSVASYEGPFDLLLHLIARRKVDIYDILLAEITDDYLAVIREMETVDLEVATDFLVVAATLVELKAARLLPDEDDPELDEAALEARDLLYARLLDYRVFKEAASVIAERLEAHDGYVPRTVPLEEPYRRCLPEVELPVDARGLAALAAQVLAGRSEPTVDVSHLQPVRLSVREAAGMVMDELERAGGRAPFRELVAGCRHRIEVVIHFLALLELYKLECVDLEQPDAFGELMVQRTRLDASLAGALDAYEGSRAQQDEQVSNR